MNSIASTLYAMFYIDKARNENLVRQAAKYLQVSERRIYAILEDSNVATIDNIAALSRFALECLHDDRLALQFIPDGYGIVSVSRGTLDGSLTDEIADVCEHSGLSVVEFRGMSYTQCRIHAQQIIDAAQRMIAECDAKEHRQTTT